jgi:molecular chaperone DnaK (HSP70)
MPGRLAIDFGTSNTIVALWDEAAAEGIPLQIPDYACLYSQGSEKIPVIPSLIHYTPDRRRWLGNQVLERNLHKSDRTFRWMKRYINNRSPIKRNLDGRQISNFQAGKDFLAGVLGAASIELNVSNEEVAFTVPVEAFEHYENWLAEAAQTAAMPRFRLLDEPSAAALGYGVHIQAGDVYLTFDFGGGTLDVAVVRIEPEDEIAPSRRCRVLGKAGCDLGGTTVDQWLYQDFLQQIGRSDTDPEILKLSGSILVECEQAKIQLSAREQSIISILDPNTGAVFEAEFSRSHFEDLLDERELVTNLNRTVRRALNDARERGYTEEQVKAVLMVGGSSQIPYIQRAVRNIFGRERVRLNRPLDAVARGAAAFVAGVDFYDHIQHDYAIRYLNREKGEYDYQILVKRGTPYPTSEPLARLTIKASYDRQTQLGLAIFELGERLQSRQNSEVEIVFDPSGAARITSVNPEDQEERNYFFLNENSPTFLTANPAASQGEARFKVEFSIDGNKRLLITSRDLKTGKLTHKDYPVVKLT